MVTEEMGCRRSLSDITPRARNLSQRERDIYTHDRARRSSARGQRTRNGQKTNFKYIWWASMDHAARGKNRNHKSSQGKGKQKRDKKARRRSPYQDNGKNMKRTRTPAERESEPAPTIRRKRLGTESIDRKIMIRRMTNEASLPITNTVQSKSVRIIKQDKKEQGWPVQPTAKQKVTPWCAANTTRQKTNPQQTTQGGDASLKQNYKPPVHRDRKGALEDQLKWNRGKSLKWSSTEKHRPDRERRWATTESRQRSPKRPGPIMHAWQQKTHYGQHAQGVQKGQVATGLWAQRIIPARGPCRREGVS